MHPLGHWKGPSTDRDRVQVALQSPGETPRERGPGSRETLIRSRAISIVPATAVDGPRRARMKPVAANPEFSLLICF